MKNRLSQSGLSLIGFLLIMILLGFISLIVIKLVPIYMDDFKVSSAMTSLQKQQVELANKSPDEIRDMLMKRLSIDNFTRFNGNDVRVTREKGKLTIAVDYEVRESLFGNLDIVARFPDHHVEIIAP